MRRVIIASNREHVHRVCLPVQGHVVVRAGQKIEEGALIAETSLPERFKVIDIANHFKVSPAEAEKMIKRMVGDVIGVGDVIAQKDGFISQLFRASEEAKIVSIREGRVTLALGLRKMQVFSPVAGTVTELISNKGAAIAISGAVLEGAWANGRIAKGRLNVWEEFERKAISSAKEKADEQVIAVCQPLTMGQLRRLLRLNPAGVVLPSVSVEQWAVLKVSEIAVLSLLGFGEQAIDPISLDMLRKMDNKKVYLLAESGNSSRSCNPLLMMPGKPEKDLGLFKPEVRLEPGVTVRLRANPYTGMVGTVKEILEEQETFASGLKSEAVLLSCADDQLIRASIHNIDLIQS